MNDQIDVNNEVCALDPVVMRGIPRKKRALGPNFF